MNEGMDAIKRFAEERRDRVAGYSGKMDLLRARDAFMASSTKEKYSYNFSWLGRPIIQYPQDIVAMQEIIWNVRPDLIVETGIAHGGSLVFYASMLELLRKDGIVVGIDVDIRDHNRKELERHQLKDRMVLIEGSSTSESVVAQVKNFCQRRKNIMVVLDSNHTHQHVGQELMIYAPLVTKGSYCVVFDTIIEDVPDGTYPDRPWGIGNNPKTAVHEFLGRNHDFIVDSEIHQKLLITVAPEGYLKRIR